MRRTELSQGLRIMKFEPVLERWRRRELSQVEAAEILGVGERTFRRWYQRHDEEGLDGLLDRRLGKPSPRWVPADWADRVEQLYRERYAGFNARHFHEHLVKDHGFRSATIGPRPSCTSACWCRGRRRRGFIA
ncbi:MAG: helix-turn-helix domain-containing protein [Alphaproteobacteria bacterium]|nr:helix-turn-helix domain-containing protein [Alphaproteobacteria bacterium]